MTSQYNTSSWRDDYDFEPGTNPAVAHAIHARQMQHAQRWPFPPAARGPIPEGWKLVPVEPTTAMLTAGREVPCNADDDDALEDYRTVYRAMLAAAHEKGNQS